MGRYRKKPVVVEVIEFTGLNAREVAEFAGYDIDDATDGFCEELIIETLEGDMAARPGSRIIKGAFGEIYPCRPDIFDATYEPVED